MSSALLGLQKDGTQATRYNNKKDIFLKQIQSRNTAI